MAAVAVAQVPHLRQVVAAAVDPAKFQAWVRQEATHQQLLDCLVLRRLVVLVASARRELARVAQVVRLDLLDLLVAEPTVAQVVQLATPCEPLAAP